MRKKILMLGSMLLLIGSYFLINQLQKSSFTVFNTVSSEKIKSLQYSLEEKDELEFTALLCNEIRVPFDESENTFYVPLDMEKDSWEKMEFVSGQQEYSVLFSEDVTLYNKQEVIAEGKKFVLTVYDQTSWANYYVVFSGLPIIDLATHEGFYSEEITGNVIFYDVDFTLNGTQQSEYNAHIRGNTSRMFPKKGYKLNLTYEIEDGVSEGNKLSLFGLRKDDDWMLHALYNDDTKIRDRLSMEVWNEFGAKAVSENSTYGPNMIYVEVFADNSYCGLYGLMEPVDAKQLNLTEDDYLYKRSNPGSLKDKYMTFINTTDPTLEVEGFEIKAGVMDEDAWEAMALISDVLSTPEEDLKAHHYTLINEDSAMRMWLFLQIITGHDHTAKNIFYVAKNVDDRKYDYEFYFAPWDMDLTWGNVSVGEINPVYSAFEMETIDNRVYWDTGDWFIEKNYNGSRNKMQELYAELRSTVLQNEALEATILELDHQVRDSGAFVRDKVRWTDSVHAEDCSVLLEYAKERLEFLDEALYDFELFE